MIIGAICIRSWNKRFAMHLKLVRLAVAFAVYVLGGGIAQPAEGDLPPQLPLFPRATTLQLPSFGISIDADGLLDVRAHAAAGADLVAERWAAARAARSG